MSEIVRIDLNERTDRLSYSNRNEFLLCIDLFMFEIFDYLYFRLFYWSSGSVFIFKVFCFDFNFLIIILGTAHTYFMGGFISLSLLLTLN